MEKSDGSAIGDIKKRIVERQKKGEHWLYGDHRKVKIVEETKCTECRHWVVCQNLNFYRSEIFEKFCENYEFGRSGEQGCQGCVNRFARWDEDAVPCFLCRVYEKL